MKLLYVTFVLCFYSSFHASELFINDFKYGQKLPKLVKAVLNAHINILEDNVSDAPEDVHVVSWLPNYLIKKSDANWGRIEGAKLFAKAIKILDMEHIFCLPKKYSYKSLTGQPYVIVEKLTNSHKDITLVEVKHIIKLAMVIGWQDSHRGNFFKMPNGMIALIDTELKAIEHSGKDLKHKIIKRMFCEQGYTPDAKDYLFKHLHSTPKRTCKK